MVQHVKNKGTCPHADCNEVVTSDSDNMKFVEAMLSSMFKEYATTYTKAVAVSGQNVMVSTLNGENVSIPYISSMTILELKQQIHQKIDVEVGKQKLVFNDKELTVSIVRIRQLGAQTCFMFFSKLKSKARYTVHVTEISLSC